MAHGAAPPAVVSCHTMANRSTSPASTSAARGAMVPTTRPTADSSGTLNAAVASVGASFTSPTVTATTHGVVSALAMPSGTPLSRTVRCSVYAVRAS